MASSLASLVAVVLGAFSSNRHFRGLLLREIVGAFHVVEAVDIGKPSREVQQIQHRKRSKDIKKEIFQNLKNNTQHERKRKNLDSSSQKRETQGKPGRTNNLWQAVTADNVARYVQKEEHHSNRIVKEKNAVVGQ